MNVFPWLFCFSEKGMVKLKTIIKHENEHRTCPVTLP